MSFDFKGVNFRPMIQEPQSTKNNGGSGGNTGYLQRGEDENANKGDQVDVFNSEKDKDSFELENYEDEQTSIRAFFEQIIAKIRSFFGKKAS